MNDYFEAKMSQAMHSTKPVHIKYS